MRLHWVSRVQEPERTALVDCAAVSNSEEEEEVINSIISITINYLFFWDILYSVWFCLWSSYLCSNLQHRLEVSWHGCQLWLRIRKAKSNFRSALEARCCSTEEAARETSNYLQHHWCDQQAPATGQVSNIIIQLKWDDNGCVSLLYQQCNNNNILWLSM